MAVQKFADYPQVKFTLHATINCGIKYKLLLTNDSDKKSNGEDENRKTLSVKRLCQMQ